MRKILAHLVPYLCFTLIAVAVYMGERIIRRLTWLPSVANILILLSGGFMLLILMLILVVGGAKLTFLASGALLPSGRGKRYLVFSHIVTAATVSTSVYVYLRFGHVVPACYLMLLYCLCSFVLTAKFRRSEKKEVALGGKHEP